MLEVCAGFVNFVQSPMHVRAVVVIRRTGMYWFCTIDAISVC
jgi:hypothetical protein